MNWHPTTEKPEEGRAVWILRRIGDAYPSDFYVVGGSVRYAETEAGWQVFAPMRMPFHPVKHFFAWAYTGELDLLPDWYTDVTKPA